MTGSLHPFADPHPKPSPHLNEKSLIAGSDLVLGLRLTLPAGDLLQLHGEWWATYGTGEPEKMHYQRVIAHLKQLGVTDGKSGNRGRFWRGIGLTGDNG